MLCGGWVCCLVLSSVAVAGDWRLEALQGQHFHLEEDFEWDRAKQAKSFHQ